LTDLAPALACPTVPEKQPKAEAVNFYDCSALIDPNEVEQLFYTLMLVRYGFDDKKAATLWAKRVLADEKSARELKTQWKPLESGPHAWVKPKNGRSELFAPMERAWNATHPDADLDAIGLAMQAWSGPGRCDNLREPQLRQYIKLAKTNGPPGPRINKKDKPPPRWRTWSIMQACAAAAAAVAAVFLPLVVAVRVPSRVYCRRARNSFPSGVC
jgi:hypothetical protein